MRNYRKEKTIDQVFILCGGLGSRLGKITKKTPKPLIKFNNKPFLDYILKSIARHNIKNIFLLCGYKDKLFTKRYDNKKILNSKIKCIVEPKPLGSGGALYNARKYMDNNFFLVNGDTFYEINFNDFALDFLNSKKILGIASLKKRGKRYLNIYKKNQKYFFSKNKGNLINSGILCLNKKIISFINKKTFSLEEECFRDLGQKKQIFVYRKKIKGTKFFDIGILQSLNKAKKIIPKLEIKKTIFLDRDGVINHDFGYVHSKKNFKWKKNIVKFIKYFNDNNYYIIVITNQSGVGRGFYSEIDVNLLHSWINKELMKKGAHIDDFFYSTYFKNSKFSKYRKNRNHRKPNNGMIKSAKKNWSIDMRKSTVVGDQLSDIEMAKKSNLKHFLVDKNTDISQLIKKII